MAVDPNKDLSPAQQAVLRDKATEAPFSGALLKNKDDGRYVCADCGAELFSSATKFESGSGWPSFYDVASDGAIVLKTDTSHGMKRTAAVCSNCGGHLGHVFEDGPQPTGQRYCINSCALNFAPEDTAKPLKRGDEAHQ